MSLYDDAVAATDPYAHYHDEGASSTAWADAEGGADATGNNGASLSGLGADNPSPQDTTPYSVTDGVDDYWAATGLQGTGYADQWHNGLSLGIWLRTTDTDFAAVFGGRNTSGNTRILILSQHDTSGYNNQAIAVNLADSANRLYQGHADMGAAINDGNWHHLVITLDGPNNTMRVFWDGAEKTVTNTRTETPSSFSALNLAPAIGAYNNQGTVGTHFAGDTWKPTPWLGLLTPTQVSDIYDAGLSALTTFSATLGGGRVVRNNFTASTRGKRATFNSFSATARGTRKLVFESFTASLRGGRAALNSFTSAARGGRTTRRTFSASASGARKSIYNTFSATLGGGRTVFGTFYSTMARGLRRIARDDQDRYELYVGTGADPDTSGTPDATSATLPFNHTLAPGATYHLVTLRRNRYGLRWPVGPVKVITLDASGDVVLPAPRAPTFTATAISAGRIRVAAEYDYQLDDEDARADRWRVWAKVGSDPVPGTDAPVATLDHVRTFNVEEVTHDTDPFAGGADVRVLVDVIRSSDGVSSGNTAAVQVTAVDAGSAFAGDKAFHGRRHRQQD